jgi:hypothetical protein
MVGQTEDFHPLGPKSSLGVNFSPAWVFKVNLENYVVRMEKNNLTYVSEVIQPITFHNNYF